MVVRPIVAQRASVKDNSIHMPCILAPTTYSYILNVPVQRRAACGAFTATGGWAALRIGDL